MYKHILKNIASDLIKSEQDVNLVHYSTQQGLRTIEPKYHGVRGIGAEVRHTSPEHKMSFYYTEGTQPEDIVMSGAKSKYTARLGDKRVYDIATDPEGVISAAKEKANEKSINRGVFTHDDMHHAIKSAGYHGFKNSSLGSQMGNVVAMYHPMEVTEHPIEFGKNENDLNKAPIEDAQDESFADEVLTNNRFSKLDHTLHATHKLKDGNYYHVYSEKHTPDDKIHVISNSKNPLIEPLSIIQTHLGSVDEHGDEVGQIAAFTATHPEYQGQGLGTRLKKLAAKYHGALYSDSITSPSENRSWEKLKKEPRLETHISPTQHDLKDQFDEDDAKSVASEQKHVAVYRPKQINKNEAADKESEVIKLNKEKPEAKKQHKFKAANWTHPNGHPRCIICGDEEGIGGICDAVDKSEIIVKLNNPSYHIQDLNKAEGDAPSQPTVQPPKHSEKVRSVAESYMKSKGQTLQHPTSKVRVDPTVGAKIAKEYENMKHDPNHPDVKAAYSALIQETSDQYQHMLNSGLEVSKLKSGMESPYKNSKDVSRDVNENNHLWYYPTSEGFGSPDSAPSDHPMLAPTKHLDSDGQPMLANDTLRVVHDFFGHVKDGHTFNHDGEENAWMSHKQMYSPLAAKALTTETKGQNHAVNWGEHGEHNRTNPSQTRYADQKAGLLPDWAHNHTYENKLNKSEETSSKPLSQHPRDYYKDKKAQDKRKIIADKERQKTGAKKPLDAALDKIKLDKAELPKAPKPLKTGDRINHTQHGAGTVRQNHNDGHYTVGFNNSKDTSLNYKGLKVHSKDFKVK